MRIVSKRCRRNGKQYRPRSECSSSSSLIWVYTVCLDLTVRKLRIITVLTLFQGRLGRLPTRLTCSKCIYFHQYLTTALLESVEGRQWPLSNFVINHNKSYVAWLKFKFLKLYVVSRVPFMNWCSGKCLLHCCCFFFFFKFPKPCNFNREKTNFGLIWLTKTIQS